MMDDFDEVVGIMVATVLIAVCGLLVMALRLA